VVVALGGSAGCGAPDPAADAPVAAEPVPADAPVAVEPVPAEPSPAVQPPAERTSERPPDDPVPPPDEGPRPGTPPEVVEEDSIANHPTYDELAPAGGGIGRDRSDSPNRKPEGDAAEAAADIRWITIPPGRYQVGAAVGEPYSDGLQSPPIDVEVTAAFQIAATETTNHQYALYYGLLWHLDNAWPAMRVNWHQATAFCEAVGGRLPTEAEWEVAARAGSTSAWSFGNDRDALFEHAWFGQPADRSPFPVASLEPNDWGLYDMHGNVWEWTSDCQEEGIYARLGGKEGLTLDDVIGVETPHCDQRMLRGGSFLDEARAQRSVHRVPYVAMHRCGTIGFRCVKGPERGD